MDRRLREVSRTSAKYPQSCNVRMYSMDRTDKARENGRNGLESVRGFMRTAAWKPEVVEEADNFCSYQVSFRDDFPLIGCLLEVYIDQQQFVCYLLLQPVVPVERRTAVAEFITRANFGMKVGNFEMNLDAGEVRYKSSLDFQQAELSEVLVHNTVMAALDSAEPYTAAFLGVVQGGKTAVEAIREVEGT